MLSLQNKKINASKSAIHIAGRLHHSYFFPPFYTYTHINHRRYKHRAFVIIWWSGSKRGVPMTKQWDFKVNVSKGRLPELLSECWPTKLLRGRLLVERCFDWGTWRGIYRTCWTRFFFHGFRTRILKALKTEYYTREKWVSFRLHYICLNHVAHILQLENIFELIKNA